VLLGCQFDHTRDIGCSPRSFGRIARYPPGQTTPTEFCRLARSKTIHDGGMTPPGLDPVATYDRPRRVTIFGRISRFSEVKSVNRSRAIERSVPFDIHLISQRHSYSDHLSTRHHRRKPKCSFAPDRCSTVSGSTALFYRRACSTSRTLNRLISIIGISDCVQPRGSMRRSESCPVSLN
jgi:hypothetical protein